MKFKKAAACVLSFALVCSLCAVNPDADIFENDTVSALSILSSKLPDNNIHPTEEKYEAPGTEGGIVPYAISATLANNNFELKNGETIDREDLKNHGIVITEQCGWLHDYFEDPLCGQITPLANGRTRERSIDICNVYIPSKLVNGKNTIYVTYCAWHFSIETTQTAELEINVKYTDGTADSAVKDYLPNHVGRTPESVFTYTNDENGETCLNVTKDKATVYTCQKTDANKTLIYEGDDIESLKHDYPDLKLSEVSDTLTYGTDTQLPCKNMSADKTYYQIDTADMTDEEFASLCAQFKDSKYGNDIDTAKFVAQNDPDHLTISFVPVGDEYVPSCDFRACKQKTAADGSVYFVHDVPNRADYLSNYFFRYTARLDIQDFKAEYTMPEVTEGPSWCYLQSVTSAVDSDDITNPYLDTVFPEINNYSKVEYSKPDVGDRDITMEDMTRLSEYLVADITLTDEELEFMDVTSDGNVTLCDLALMKQYLMLDDVTLWPGK